MLAADGGGVVRATAMRGMPSRTFWTSHVIHDVVGAYYAHPSAWSEIGWGGPARRAAMFAWVWIGATHGSRGRPAGQGRARRAGKRTCPLTPSPLRAPQTGGRPMCFAAAAGCRCGNSAMTRKSTSPLSGRARGRSAACRLGRARLFGGRL